MTPRATIPKVFKFLAHGFPAHIAKALAAKTATHKAVVYVPKGVGKTLGRHNPSNKYTGRGIGDASWTALSSA
jgi:L-ascorbate metabolism protein UlaG (beta-lactamase superfamily)